MLVKLISEMYKTSEKSVYFAHVIKKNTTHGVTKSNIGQFAYNTILGVILPKEFPQWA